MNRLIKISESENEFLVFDSDVTELDMARIYTEWKKTKEEHPTWDRYDLIGELIENTLPKIGLKAEYHYVDAELSLPYGDEKKSAARVKEFVVTNDPIDSSYTLGYAIVTDSNNVDHRCTWSTKHFVEGSEYGIDNGRISKLFVVQEDKKTGISSDSYLFLFDGCILNYDRGWDIEPEGEIADAIYRRLCEEYN